MLQITNNCCLVCTASDLNASATFPAQHQNGKPHVRNIQKWLKVALGRERWGLGQGPFAESAIIMCTGFNIIPCMQKMALSSVLVTPAQKRPFYELSLDTVWDVFYLLSLGPHFCYPIPSFDNRTGGGWGLMGIDHFIGSTSPKLCMATVSANRISTDPKHHAGRKWLTRQERFCPTSPSPPPPPQVHTVLKCSLLP